MNQNSRAGLTMNSTVPAFRYSTARAASTAASVMRWRVASSSKGEGDSSMTFW